MDVASLLGGMVCFLALAGALFLGGGDPLTLLDLSALWLIVGGTIGALLLASPFPEFSRMLSALPGVLARRDSTPRPLIEDILRIALLARKEGVLAVEGSRASVRDPLFQRTLKYVIDGFEAPAVREMIESEIQELQAREERSASILELGAGLAPVLGILGAVLALIPALSDLSQPTRLGPAISSAFTSVFYGMGLGSLLLAPLAAKLRSNAQAATRRRHLVRVGVVGILEGLNPQFLKERLEILARED